MRSIRQQLVANVFISGAVLYAAWATGFCFYTWNALNQQFNSALEDKAHLFMQLIELERSRSRFPTNPRGTQIELEFLQLSLPEFQPSPEAMFYQLAEVDGDCTCPVGWNCKHVVAVVLSLERQLRSRARALPAVRPGDDGHYQSG